MNAIPDSLEAWMSDPLAKGMGETTHMSDYWSPDSQAAPAPETPLPPDPPRVLIFDKKDGALQGCSFFMREHGGSLKLHKAAETHENGRSPIH